MLALSGSAPILAQNTTSDQDAADNEGVLEEVIVTGVKHSLTAAVEVKRTSMEIVDAIVAEDLGKFPDNNVVEAMQRIPGVQVTNRGAGEVSSVSIRGLSDVTTTINGRNIFTAAGRQVALADIPATLVNRVDVYKTRSPEQISRGLAGQIDVHTNRPFDFDGFKLSAQLRTTYQEQTEEFDPNIAFLVSNTWDTAAGEFGALFNASYAETNWKDQGVHAGASVPFRPLDHPYEPLFRIWGGWTPGLDRGQPTNEGAVLDPSGEEFLHGRDAMFQPHVTGERERPAWNASLQWAPNDTSEYMFEVFYNGYRNKQHNGLFFTFVDWWLDQDLGAVNIYPGTNVVKSREVNFPFSFVSGDVLEAETDSYLYALGGKWDLGDEFSLRSELVYQDSEFKDEFFAMRMNRWSGYYPGSHYELFVDFNQGNGVPYVEFYDDPNTEVDESDATDPRQWELAQLYDNGQKDSGDAFTWTADADWDVNWGSEGRGIKTISFGLRYDSRSAIETGYSGGDRGCWASPTCAGSTYEDFPGLVGTISNHFDGNANVLTSWAIPTMNGLLSNQEAIRSAWGNDAYPAAGNKVYETQFDIDETLTEAYVQADFEFDLGVNSYIDGRVGFRWVDQETDMAFPNPDTGGIDNASNSNSTVLPSLMVRWGITEELMARFSYTEVYELPAFGDLSPYIQYFADVTDIGYGTASGGNPDLKPIESENMDISLEWYFQPGGVLYGTYFRRDISNNVVGFRNPVQYDDPDDDPDRGLYTYILSQPDNAGESTLDGWEFGFTYFPELPGWFNGLGLQASYTILDSEQEIPVTDDEGNIAEWDILPIGGVSEDSYSIILAYDRETFNARLSWFWRDDFYDRSEAALFANPLQIWKSAEESLDFQLTWHMAERWTLTFDATNLTDPIYSENYGNMPQIFNHVNNYFSKTYSVGLRYQL